MGAFGRKLDRLLLGCGLEGFNLGIEVGRELGIWSSWVSGFGIGFCPACRSPLLKPESTLWKESEASGHQVQGLGLQAGRKILNSGFSNCLSHKP